tara:strand:- start:29 stop:280 length:252 start_codon:yes stop_codon:yes gene_type:complete
MFKNTWLYDGVDTPAGPTWIYGAEESAAVMFPRTIIASWKIDILPVRDTLTTEFVKCWLNCTDGKVVETRVHAAIRQVRNRLK